MSMTTCHLCGDFVDSDAFPEGGYTVKYPDAWICENCIENHELEMQQ